MQVAYSKDMNHKMMLEFSLDLPVGMESIGEVAEVIMNDQVKIPFFVKALNEVLPKGIAVLSAQEIEFDDDSNNSNNLVPKATLHDKVYRVTYEIWFDYNEQEFKGKNKREIQDIKRWYVDRMQEFLTQPSIYIIRKNDDKVDRLNIKQQLHDFSFMLDYSLILTIDAGMKTTLTPAEIMRGYEEYSGKPIDYSVRRRKIFVK